MEWNYFWSSILQKSCTHGIMYESFILDGILRWNWDGQLELVSLNLCKLLNYPKLSTLSTMKNIICIPKNQFKILRLNLLNWCKMSATPHAPFLLYDTQYKNCRNNSWKNADSPWEIIFPHCVWMCNVELDVSESKPIKDASILISFAIRRFAAIHSGWKSTRFGFSEGPKHVYLFESASM